MCVSECVCVRSCVSVCVCSSSSSSVCRCVFIVHVTNPLR